MTKKPLNIPVPGPVAERAEALLWPQGDLLGLPRTAKVETVLGRRAPGRPPGSPNKRAEDVARLIVDRIGDPLIKLATLAAMPADELAAAASCTVMEALNLQRLAAAEVLPYVHQRRPQALEVKGGSVVALTIHTGLATAAPPPVTIVGAVAESVENQRVSEVPDAPV